jgi:lysophospholipid acyltransferase (LPLAT)-like uncharacterized protein
MTPAAAPSRDPSAPRAKAGGDGTSKLRRGDWFYSLVLAPLAALLVRLLARTLRVRFVGRDRLDVALAARRPVIFAFWHENLFASAVLHMRVNWRRPGGKRVAVMVSHSRDGQKLAEVISRLGLEPIRGSSSLGAVAGLVELAHWLRRADDGRSRFVALAMDGPRGPRHVAKPGVALLARQAGALVLPVSFELSRQWVFRSWDRARLAKPWATLECRFWAPVDPAAWEDLGPEAQARRLEAMLSETEPTTAE